MGSIGINMSGLSLEGHLDSYLKTYLKVKLLLHFKSAPF
jgi:hypothetical protein